MLHHVMEFIFMCLLLLLLRVNGESANPIATGDKRSPMNMVGLVDGSVTLDCIRRNTTGEVTWKYIRPGSDKYDPIPCRYRSQTSNYGTHQIVLEKLHLDDAGTYVCTSANEEFENAGAYVLVVALGTVCMSNITTNELVEGDAIKLTCAITYSAMPGVYLELGWKENDGQFEERKNFSAASSGLSFHSLTSFIRAKSPAVAPHTCEVTFHEIVSRHDMADNSPSFENDASRCVVPSWPVAVRGRSTSSSQSISSSAVSTDADNVQLSAAASLSLIMVFILLSVSVVILAAALVLVCSHRRKLVAAIRGHECRDPFQVGASLLPRLGCSGLPNGSVVKSKLIPPVPQADDGVDMETVLDQPVSELAGVSETEADYRDLNPETTASRLDSRQPSINLRSLNPVGQTIAEIPSETTVIARQAVDDNATNELRDAQENDTLLQLPANITTS